MEQLIINGTIYPEASRDNYKCYPKDLKKKLRMSLGNLTTEKRCTYNVIEYKYDYFPPELRKTCMRDLMSGENLDVMYRSPDSDDLVSGTFQCTVSPTPDYAFSKNNSAYWHTFAFVLEEVESAEQK